MPYRSRSPLRQTAQSERISRTIAGFGRYAERRPHGLHVDSSGALRLDDLMRVWGRHEGYKEQEVLDAVRRHMFHESGGGGASALRFAIDTDSSQRIIIRVMPKKTAGREGMTPPPSPGRAPAPPPQRGAPPQLHVRPLHGSVLQQVAQGAPPPPPKAAPEALKSGFIPVHGQEVPAAGTGDRMDVDSGPTMDEKRASVQRSCEQMGLTPETSHIRQAPQSSASAREEEPRAGDRDRGRGSGRRCRRGDRGDRGGSAGEKVSRWLSWALNHGHRELMLDVDVHGWASLEALASGLRRSRSDFGDVNAQKLQALLEDTDHEGRFEISSGRLRKLGRDRRQPRPERRAPPPAPSGASAGDRTPGSYGRGRSRSLSSSSLRSVRRRRSPSRSASPVVAASADGASRQPPPESGTGKPPPPAPNGGDGWTKYQDDGRDWYYYEGPLGKWWTEVGSSEMQRYEE